jgi:hypothetical protein
MLASFTELKRRRHNRKVLRNGWVNYLGPAAEAAGHKSGRNQVGCTDSTGWGWMSRHTQPPGGGEKNVS